jgi:galactokinase
MKQTNQIITALEKGELAEVLRDIYVDQQVIPYQTERYIKAVKKFEELYGAGEVEVFSAPGRSEIGGNHTDHQHGEVLAASINLDALAIVRPLAEAEVRVVSGDSPMITVSLSNLDINKDEEGTTLSLIKGVLAGIKNRGYNLGGFETYITSDVLIGAGLSSSAAFETIIGTIISGLYNESKISAVEIAIIGQYAENVYFGKPCGLMDQMACSVGSLVHIDFANPAEPVIEKVEFDLDAQGYSLCITDTKGSHADLTADYAAIPEEMKKIAAYFGKEVLREVSASDILTNIGKLREEFGDRAVLRALHFVSENVRVQEEVAALKSNDINKFLDTVKKSGNSSYKYLQNVYVNHDITHQNMSIALAVSDLTLGANGASRVHGGGFAGTIQAFVKNEDVQKYKDAMDAVFGTGACNILKIRKYGGIKVTV